MKRIFSVFLLFVFLFNTVGYYGLYVVLSDQANLDFSKRLEEESYSGHDAIILKIPMALPYPPNFDGYERANGEFEYQGEYYRIAKYRHINDTLLVVMVKNKRETSLHQSITHFVQASNDVPSSASSIKLMVSFAKEFISNSSHLLVGSVGWCASLALVDFEKKTISPYSHLIHPPPPKHRLQHTLQLPHTKSWWL